MVTLFFSVSYVMYLVSRCKRPHQILIKKGDNIKIFHAIFCVGTVFFFSNTFTLHFELDLEKLGRNQSIFTWQRRNFFEKWKKRLFCSIVCELGFLSVFELFDVNKHSSKVVHRVLLSLILTLECHFFFPRKNVTKREWNREKKTSPKCTWHVVLLGCKFSRAKGLQ